MEEADFSDPHILASALSVAIKSGDLQQVRSLLPASSPYKELVVGRYGVTSINLSAIEGQLAILEYLVGIGCDVDHQDIDRFNSVHLATWYGHCHIIEFLHSIRPSLFFQAQQGNYPVHLATYRKQYEALVVLAKYSDINKQDKTLTTPLRIFIQNNDLAGVEACLKAGARIRNVDFNTRSNPEIKARLRYEQNWRNRKTLLLVYSHDSLSRLPYFGQLPSDLVYEILHFL